MTQLTAVQRRCVAFGRELIATSDLDPLYTVLDAAQLDGTTLGRFLLAYGMLYHAGVAAWIADQEHFWDAVLEVLPTAPRGTERRHFRGALAQDAVSSMMEAGNAEQVLDVMFPEYRMTFQQVYTNVQKFHGWGSWISFKMADIADRTRYIRVDFAGCELSIYRDPVKGAALWRYGDQNASIKPHEVGEVCEELRLALGEHLLAPPLYERPINIQEVETVLCKFKSHTNGHYPMGKDTVEVMHALHLYDNRLSRRLRACPLL